MKTRILSGIIMLPLLTFVFVGGKLLLIGCFILAISALREFYNGFGNLDIKPSSAIGFASAFLLYSINLIEYNIPSLNMLWIFVVIISCMIYLFKVDEVKIEDGMATMMGIFYIVFFSYHIVLVEQTGEHSLFVWLIFFTALGTDVFAYFSGYVFGKHKLSPKISPKKTIEGSIGGILGSVLLCGLFGYFLMPLMLIHCVIIGIIASVLSQIGDLTASIFKRKMGLKDYGNLIPGHGGVLDRIDSLLFTAPLIYYYIVIVL